MPMRILSLFRNLFRKRAVEQELNDELRSSVEVLTEEKIKQGVSPSAARREALMEIGGVEQVKEEVRAVRAGRILEDCGRDLRYAFRTLAKSPGFATVAVLTLALGIGANTAIFSVVYGVLLRPLPYPHPERIISISRTYQGELDYSNFTAAGFDFWKEHNDLFQYVTASTDTGFNLGGAGRAVRVRAGRVSVDYFRVLGVEPVLGRSFLPEEDEPGGANVTILSYSLWQRQFGGDPKAIA
jgi:putative ABC transport system permease protein